MDKKQKIKKVIQIIWNILSVIFVAFVSGALIINSIKGADEKTQDIVTPNIQEVKSHKNYGYVDEYGVQASIYQPDFMSNDFIITFINSISKDYNVFLPSSTSTGYVLFTNTDNRYQGFIYDVTLGALSTLRSTGYNFIFNKSSAVEFNNGVIATEYYLTIRASNNVDNILEYHYWVNYPVLDQYEKDLGMSCVRVVQTYAPNTDWWAYYENDNDYFSPLIQYYVKPKIENLTDRYMEGYNNGYNSGYGFGYKVGNDTGYNKGLEDGAQGIETNAFTVIGQAFGAAANILNVQVLPGLSLWVLVTAPLVIAIVIVIVKMIKG